MVFWSLCALTIIIAVNAATAFWGPFAIVRCSFFGGCVFIGLFTGLLRYICCFSRGVAYLGCDYVSPIKGGQRFYRGVVYYPRDVTCRKRGMVAAMVCVILNVFNFVVVVSVFHAGGFLLSLFVATLRNVTSLVTTGFVKKFFNIRLDIGTFSLNIYNLNKLPKAMVLLVASALFGV